MAQKKSKFWSTSVGLISMGLSAWSFAPANAQTPLTDPFHDVDFQHSLDLSTETEMTTGNQMELVSEAARPAKILELISRAEKLLLIAVPALECHGVWGQIADQAIARKKAGVEVKIYVEGASYFPNDDFCTKHYRNGGIEVVRARQGRMISNVLKDIPYGLTHWAKTRVHFWLRDGVESVVSAEPSVWVKSGPVNTDLFAIFFGLWQTVYYPPKHSSMSDYLLQIDLTRAKEFQALSRGPGRYRDWFEDPAKRMNGNCRVMVQPFFTGKNAIGDLVGALMLKAQERVIWASPIFKNAYRLPTYARQTLDLKLAKIEWITNSRDALVAQGRSARCYRETQKMLGQLDLGSEFSQGFALSHYRNVRAGMIDHSVSILTTASWDEGGTNINQELVLVCMDERLNADLEHYWDELKADASSLK